MKFHFITRVCDIHVPCVELMTNGVNLLNHKKMCLDIQCIPHFRYLRKNYPIGPWSRSHSQRWRRPMGASPAAASSYARLATSRTSCEEEKSVPDLLLDGPHLPFSEGGQCIQQQQQHRLCASGPWVSCFATTASKHSNALSESIFAMWDA